MAIKIIIADDHKLFREGLVNLLSDAGDIEIVGEAENGKMALEQIEKLNPNVVLMDVSMPVMSGVEATRNILKNHPEVKVIALTMHSDQHYVKAMLEAGARGYLFKNCTYDQLIDAINSVHSGKKYLSNDITEVLIQEYLNKDENKAETTGLTARELEVLILFAEGKSTKEIADEIFVSIKTVGTHRQHILEKLNLNSTADMVKYAIRNGLVSLE
ncbi:MAG: response regulator transcription factor [Bacteroidales bacterium]|nr:response regulator transcription factor [Bacteroidales bacterium]MCF8343569.1 response regulator transcription factor [Bacteroidales bacterium]MCF8350251.1 response regulator transcription factor [Bacteroidales bacterium]MCF8375804.1 response regulator transcription factor [Bacteroidales bacterium]MCF8401730.1 response regulator transcription factor [Bacteroidales bacterium]